MAAALNSWLLLWEDRCRGECESRYPKCFTNMSEEIVYRTKFGLISIQSMDDGRNVKCPRCWQYHGVIENFENLCDRCSLVILKDYSEHKSAPFIKAVFEQQRKIWSG